MKKFNHAYGLTRDEIADDFGVSTASVTKWVKLIGERFPELPLETYEDFKLAVNTLRGWKFNAAYGLTRTEIAKEFGVNVATIADWVKAIGEHLPDLPMATYKDFKFAVNALKTRYIPGDTGRGYGNFTEKQNAARRRVNTFAAEYKGHTTDSRAFLELGITSQAVSKIYLRAMAKIVAGLEDLQPSGSEVYRALRECLEENKEKSELLKKV